MAVHLTRRGAAWIALNLAAAVLMPLLMSRWIRALVASSDAALPDGFTPSTLVAAFTLAWLLFLVLLNLALVLFLWLTGR